MSKPIPKHVPFLDIGAMTRDVEGAIDDAWKEITFTSSFIGGEKVTQFENAWAAYCGTKFAVGVANGTDAIELTLRALDIGPGDEVIIPTNTFVATVEAVVLAGATPQFVDVAPGTLLLTADAVSDAVNHRTSAVIPVHLYGNMPDMTAICATAKRHGLAVIEDAAQAQGAGEPGRRAGSFGLGGCFSFYPGKNLGAFGDAGAIVTDDEYLARRLRSLGNHGRSDCHTSHDLIGRNSRLDALQAAVLSCKLSKLDEWNTARMRALSTYRELLPADQFNFVESSPGGVGHLNVMLVPNRDRLREQLGHRGIETGIHYPVPCHLQPAYKQFGTASLPVAEAAAGQLLSLPLFPHLERDKIAYVCEQLIELTEGANVIDPRIELGQPMVIDEGVIVGYDSSRGNSDALVIGAGARLRSGTVVYRGSRIGVGLQTGHNVTIREESIIGDDVSIWTNSVIDYGCRIGDRVKIHSNCYVAQFTEIEEDAFLAPGVTLANDLYPGYTSSAEVMAGPYIEAGAQIGVNATILPYVRIGTGAIIGAGAVVTRDVPAYAVAFGSPAVVTGSRDELGDVDLRVRVRASSPTRLSEESMMRVERLSNS